MKISELNNEQLLASIEKYQKIIDQLHAERKRRVKEDPNSKNLISSSKAPKDHAREHFRLELDDDDFKAIEDTKETEAAGEESFDDEEESKIRVTKLLSLSKEELEKYQAEKDATNISEPTVTKHGPRPTTKRKKAS